MKAFIQEFKAFAMRGNVVDLAVAVVIGAAFGKIVTSLVNNIVMPLIGLILGGINFTRLSFSIGSANIEYGEFLQATVDFVIVAFAIFIAVKLITRLKRTEPLPPVAEESREVQLLTQIRDLLRNRP